MYDLLIGLFEAIFRHGWSLSSAGAIVFLLLKQRKMKNRLKRFLPWMFAEDNEIKEYIRNQIVILENQERIMISMGVEPCANGYMTKSSPVDPKSSNILSKLSQMDTVQEWRSRREKKMMNLKTMINKEDIKALIDGGHGGHDPGAIGFSGKKEKDFALTMVKKIEKRLNEGGKVKPILSRTTDTFVELKERVKIAKKNKVDVFVSIHLNSAGSIATGTETLYTREESKGLANTIHKHLIAATGLKDRGVKYQNIHVTRETDMPAVLLEVGFINNPNDEDKLFNEDYQNRVADAIVQGIYEYLGVKIEAPEPVKPTYTEMDITVHAEENKKYIGYNIKGTTWIPSRPIGELLGGRIGYTGGKVRINGTAVDTQNFGGIGYVQSRDLTKLLNARIFWDKSDPNRVDIYTNKGV